MTPSSSRAATRAGGASLLLAAVLFMAVFGYLAGTFGYPDVLDQPAAEVLPRLLALGTPGRLVWTIYALVPLLLIPGATGAAALHHARGPSAMLRTAQATALVAALAMTLGLMRWPSIQWELARAWTTADTGQRVVLGALFDGLNTYLGRFVGEFLGELTLNATFVFFGAMAIRHGGLPRAVAWMGVVAGGVGLVASLRNVTPLVAPVAEVNNLLLPVWLIVWGVALWRARPQGLVTNRSAASAAATESPAARP